MLLFGSATLLATCSSVTVESELFGPCGPALHAALRRHAHSTGLDLVRDIIIIIVFPFSNHFNMPMIITKWSWLRIYMGLGLGLLFGWDWVNDDLSTETDRAYIAEITYEAFKARLQLQLLSTRTTWKVQRSINRKCYQHSVSIHTSRQQQNTHYVTNITVTSNIKAKPRATSVSKSTDQSYSSTDPTQVFQ